MLASYLNKFTIPMTILLLTLHVAYSACPLSYIPRETKIGYITAQLNYNPDNHDKVVQYTYPLKDSVATVPKVAIGVNQMDYQVPANGKISFDISFTPAGGSSRLLFIVMVQSQKETRDYGWNIIKWTFISTVSDLIELNIYSQLRFYQQTAYQSQTDRKYSFQMNPFLPMQTLNKTKALLFLSGIKLEAQSSITEKNLSFYIDQKYQIEVTPINQRITNNIIKSSLITSKQLKLEYLSVSIIVFGQDLIRENLLIFESSIRLLGSRSSISNKQTGLGPILRSSGIIPQNQSKDGNINNSIRGFGGNIDLSLDPFVSQNIPAVNSPSSDKILKLDGPIQRQNLLALLEQNRNGRILQTQRVQPQILQILNARRSVAGFQFADANFGSNAEEKNNQKQNKNAQQEKAKKLVDNTPQKSGQPQNKQNPAPEQDPKKLGLTLARNTTKKLPEQRVPSPIISQIQFNSLPIMDLFIVGIRGITYSPAQKLNFQIMIDFSSSLLSNITKRKKKQASQQFIDIRSNLFKQKFDTLVGSSLFQSISSVQGAITQDSSSKAVLSSTFQSQFNQLFLNYFGAQRRNSFICTECPNSPIAFQSFCIQQCPFGYVQNSQNSIIQCKYCNISKLFVANSQKNQCDCAQQHFEGVSNAKNRLQITRQVVCMPCHYTCLTCQNEKKNSCLTCDTKQQKTKRQLSKKRECICPSGYFDQVKKENIICQKCHTSCKTCTNSVSEFNCQDCATGRAKNKDGICVCLNGFSTDKITGACICPVGKIQINKACLSSPTARLSSGACRFNQVFNQKTKICECQNNSYYLNGHCETCLQSQKFDKQTNQCECTKKKAVKSTKTGECVICDEKTEQFNKISQQCVCKNNFIKNSKNKCEKCPARSEASNGKCECVFNYYFDQRLKKCRRCLSSSDGPKCLNIYQQ